jgi:hypothetical protein
MHCQAVQAQLARHAQPEPSQFTCCLPTPSFCSSFPTALLTWLLLSVNALSRELFPLRGALTAGAGLGSHQTPPLLGCRADSSTDGTCFAV